MVITIHYMYSTYIVVYLLNLPDYSFNFNKYKLYNHNYTYVNIDVI